MLLFVGLCSAAGGCSGYEVRGRVVHGDFGGLVTVVDEDDDIFTIDIGGQRMRVVKRAVAGKTQEDDS